MAASRALHHNYTLHSRYPQCMPLGCTHQLPWSWGSWSHLGHPYSSETELLPQSTAACVLGAERGRLKVNCKFMWSTTECTSASRDTSMAGDCKSVLPSISSSYGENRECHRRQVTGHWKCSLVGSALAGRDPSPCQ